MAGHAMDGPRRSRRACEGRSRKAIVFDAGLKPVSTDYRRSGPARKILIAAFARRQPALCSLPCDRSSSPIPDHDGAADRFKTNPGACPANAYLAGRMAAEAR
ncbi:hypothetical protein [Sphingomonas sp.]|uniref:hypothetical protein n=1 Tax=Sphingomonas sp. TaxID=28214 RepID=UPI002897F7AB|nr:hypothetical protein [Sphingomonas sp.]